MAEGTKTADRARARTAEEPTGRLLIVDDNENNRDMLGRRLQRRGFEIEEAANGKQALEMIEAKDYDLIILDVMMPVMDGITALKKIRERHEPTELGVLMATAKDQPEDIVEALKAGANDYVTKPINFQVALARIETRIELRRSVDEIKLLQQRLALRNEELEASNERMRRDLEAAARIQQSFLPKPEPRVETASFSWHYEPCDELAGDTLNIVPLDSENIGVFVVDVSGHGVPAALLSVTVSQQLSKTSGPDCILCRPGWKKEGGAGLEIVPPSKVAAELAGRFPPNPETHQYFTLIYGVLNLPSRTFTFVCAGHPGPVYLPREGSAEILQHPGVPIGMLPVEMVPDGWEDKTVTLGVGDRLYLYTDGVPECQDLSEEDFGEERMLDVLESTRQEPLNAGLLKVLQALNAFAGNAGMGDDVSMVALEIA